MLIVSSVLWRLSGWGRCNTRAVASIRSPIRSPPHRLVSTFAVLTGLLRSITKRLFVLGVVLLFAHASLFLLSLVSTREDEFRANEKVLCSQDSCEKHDRHHAED
jgi:hypothetical protein